MATTARLKFHTSERSQETEPGLQRLNAVRLVIVLLIGLGYASTMPIGPGNAEWLQLFGYDPSWYGVQALFCLSGYLGVRSLTRHGSARLYLTSRAVRNLPILALYTLAVVSLIYPIFCGSNSGVAQDFGRLSFYFFETVSMLDPGRPLPGLLDDSLYMCLIQGAIWTLRWGAFAHFALAVGWQLKILQPRFALPALSLLSLLCYAAVTHYIVNTGAKQFDSLLPGMKVGYAFLGGAALFVLRNKLPTRWTQHGLILFALFGCGFIQFTVLPWTPFIDVVMSIFWSYLALALVLTPAKLTNFVKSCPNLTAGVYFSTWPIAQVLVLSFPEITAAVLVPATLGLSLALALVTYRLFREALTYPAFEKRDFTWSRSAST